MKYIATFPAGAYPILLKQFKQFSLDQFRVVEHDESQVVFSSTLSMERLIELRYFKALYVVVEGVGSRRFLKGSYFRLMLLQQGEPQPLPQMQRRELEHMIHQKLGLTPHARLSRNDFYVIERASGESYLALRLARAKFKREHYAAGELRPELAHILCLAAGLKGKHHLLDPFAGYGAIPFEAVRGFGCHYVDAVDQVALPSRHEITAIHWHSADSTKGLPFIRDASIDRVITDPPWGSFDASIDLTTLYIRLGQELLRVLRPGGVAVVLSGYMHAGDDLMQTEGLTMVTQWPLLVSGKKATIYKLQKSPTRVA